MSRLSIEKLFLGILFMLRFLTLVFNGMYVTDKLASGKSRGCCVTDKTLKVLSQETGFPNYRVSMHITEDINH